MNIEKVKKYVLPNLPYAMIFWFFTKCGESYRLSSETDTIRKLMDMLTNLGIVTSNPLPSLNPFDLLIGMIGAIGIYGIVWYKKKNAKNWRKDVEYGSARWGTPKDIEPFIDPVPDNNIILTATESLTLNSRPKNPKYARNKNILCIGGSGSGKTRFFLKPNLMAMHSSYVVTDPKGSILIECGRLLKRGAPKTIPIAGKDGKPLKDKYGNVKTKIARNKQGKIIYEPYEIKVLNTIDFNKSMHYNPFVYIRSEKDILKFVTALIANTKGEGKSADPFWEKAETLLYCALIGYIYYEAEPHERNMNSLVEMINLMEVKEDDENFKNTVDYLFDDLEQENPQHFALRQYKKFKLSAGKTAKSILVSCGARLAVFDLHEVRELMSYDEMELDTIGDRKTALFIIISDTDDSFSFIAALMYSQLFNLLCDKADNEYGGRLPVHVRFLLDEFANIGQIPKFDKLIATIRSREMSACVVLQAQSQLKAIYKDNTDTIIGNCDTVLFLGGKEKTTLKDLTESIGKETVYMLTNNTSKGNNPSYSMNQQKLGRELMSIDELSIMDGNKCILQLRGVRPFFSDKFDITKHKNYRYLSDANPKYAFNIEKHVNRKLKVKPTDTFEFHEFSTDETEVYQDYEEDLEPI